MTTVNSTCTFLREHGLPNIVVPFYAKVARTLFLDASGSMLNQQLDGVLLGLDLPAETIKQFHQTLGGATLVHDPIIEAAKAKTDAPVIFVTDGYDNRSGYNALPAEYAHIMAGVANYFYDAQTVHNPTGISEIMIVCIGSDAVSLSDEIAAGCNRGMRRTCQVVMIHNNMPQVDVQDGVRRATAVHADVSSGRPRRLAPIVIGTAPREDKLRTLILKLAGFTRRKKPWSSDVDVDVLYDCVIAWTTANVGRVPAETIQRSIDVSSEYKSPLNAVLSAMAGCKDKGSLCEYRVSVHPTADRRTRYVVVHAP